MMRSLAIFGGLDAYPARQRGVEVEIDEAVVRSAIVETVAPHFDPRAPEMARRVLVRVSAFSCNYRDKSFILQMRRIPYQRFFVIGSELVGTVVQVGSEVTSVRPGDRVVGQNHYARGINEAGEREGVVTNQASKELQVLHETKLARIPDAMSDEVAAGFSLAAQTAYSMIRKIAPEPGEPVLVTSATSNTALLVISALRRRGARIFASTSSTRFDDRLTGLGVERIVRVEGKRASFRENEEVARLAEELDGFAAVVDPFFDLHVERAVQVLAPFGRYVTCGLAGQNPAAARHAGVGPLDGSSILLAAMVKNLTLYGNCLGLTSDLEAALRDYGDGGLRCVVDSVFTGTDTAGFLDRTYNDRTRFGKVIFQYTN